jgi:membrane protein DedA with SNARE-associated domain
MRFLAIIVAEPLRWAVHFGAIGLIALAFIDNSIIPLPGGMDAGVLLLSYRNPDSWWLYSLSATVGAVIAGYMTYRIACAGGREFMEKKLKKPIADRATRMFERWGFGSIVVGALLPPPIPFTPFLVTAGCMSYPRPKFLAALALGRAIRYALVGWLGSIYGRVIWRFAKRHSIEALWIVTALGVAAGLAALWWYMRERKKRRAEIDAPAAKVA